jgi:hypothetical protein
MRNGFLNMDRVAIGGLLTGSLLGLAIYTCSDEREKIKQAAVQAQLSPLPDSLSTGTYSEPEREKCFSYGATTNQDVINLLQMYGRSINPDRPWCLADEWARSGGPTLKDLQNAGRNERYCGPWLPEELEDHLYLFNAGVRERKDKLTIRFNEPKPEGYANITGDWENFWGE